MLCGPVISAAIFPAAPLSAAATTISRPASACAGLDGTLVYPLSASSADGLRDTAGRLADWVDAQASKLAAPSLAYTLARRRAHRTVRTAVLAGSIPYSFETLKSLSPIIG